MEEDGVRLPKNWETTELNTWSKIVSKLWSSAKKNSPQKPAMRPPSCVKSVSNSLAKLESPLKRSWLSKNKTKVLWVKKTTSASNNTTRLKYQSKLRTRSSERRTSWSQDQLRTKLFQGKGEREKWRKWSWDLKTTTTLRTDSWWKSVQKAWAQFQPRWALTTCSKCTLHTTWATRASRHSCRSPHQCQQPFSWQLRWAQTWVDRLFQRLIMLSTRICSCVQGLVELLSWYQAILSED